MSHIAIGLIALIMVITPLLSAASEITSVNPDFIKMRHTADVKVNVNEFSDDLHVSLIPGGAYIDKTKKVNKLSLIYNDLLIQIEQRSQIIIYKANQSSWQEIGFIDIKQAIKKLRAFDGKILASTTKDIIELDIRTPSLPKIESRHSHSQDLIDFSESNTHLCTLNNKSITLKNKDTNLEIHSGFTNNQISQVLSHQQYCISLSEDSGIEVWAEKSGILIPITQYLPNTIARELIIEKDMIAIANGTTGITLLKIDPHGKLKWLGSYNKLGNIIHIAYSNNHLVAADDKGVLSVFDISEPSTPLLISDFHSHHQIDAITLHNKQSYLLSEDRIFSIDFRSNSSPMISTLGVNQGGSRRSYIENDILYVADWFSGLHLYDIRTPSNPRLLSSFHTPGSPKGVVVKNGFAFVADDDHGLQVINVSNPLSPSFVSEIPLSGLAYTMKLINNLLYIASHRGGFHIVDVSKPESPVLVSTYDTPSKAWALEYQDGLLYVADDSSGLMIFDVKNPAQPILINQFSPAGFSTNGFAEDVILKNNKAYIAFFDLGLFIIDISNPLKLKQLAHLQTPGNARGIEIKDDLLYLASWEAGVQIIDISNDTQPFIIGHYDTKGAVWGLSVKKKMIYAMDWWGGVKVIDARQTNKPFLISQYQTAGLINDLQYYDKFIYTAHGSRGLQIYDANNDLNPVWATGVDIAGNAKAISINQTRGLAIVAAGDGGIVVADIRNPFQAKLLGQLSLGVAIDFIQTQGNFAIAAVKEGDLYLIDIQNPSFPRLLNRLPMTVNSLITLDSTNDKNGDVNLYVLSNYQTLSHFIVNKLTGLRKEKQFTLPFVAKDLQFIDESHFVFYSKNQLTSCSILKSSLSCLKEISLPVDLLDIHIIKNQLYATTNNNDLYVFTLEQNNALHLNTIYPTSHHINRISNSKDGIFFGGESVIASGKLLPKLKIESKDNHFNIKIPANMPKGAYHIALTDSAGNQTIKKNAVIIGFPKLKSKFTLEQLKAIMKQKNFEGKAPENP